MIKISDKDKGNVQGLSFIDLFAGIGGFRYAFESFGCKCVFSSEWDKESQRTYFDNFGEIPKGVITKIDEKEIFPHNILVGGFPCQAFSISGKRMGFQDTRGTLFFDIARIVDHHKPEILVLENVKNIVRHEEGKTLITILQTLKEIGYTVFHKVLSASDYGLPQSRERIFFVGFRSDLNIVDFSFPNPSDIPISLNDIFQPDSEIPSECYIQRDDISLYGSNLLKENLFSISPNRPIQIGIINHGGQGERIYDPKGHAITLSAYGGGPGGKTGAYYINGKIRKLTPRECARVQGFPETFILHPSRARCYTQFGNSVPINVLQFILIQINATLKRMSINITPR